MLFLNIILVAYNLVRALVKWAQFSGVGLEALFYSTLKSVPMQNTASCDVWPSAKSTFGRYVRPECEDAVIRAAVTCLAAHTLCLAKWPLPSHHVCWHAASSSVFPFSLWAARYWTLLCLAHMPGMVSSNLQIYRLAE